MLADAPRSPHPLRRRTPWLWLAGAAGAQAAALAGLLALGDPDGRRGTVVLLLAVASIGMVGVVAAARRLPLEHGRQTLCLLAIATLLRALLLPLPPTLSSDVWRYLWEGGVAAAGGNPYLQPPADPALAARRDAVWERVEHRELAAIYPPLAMSAMSLVARFPEALRLPAWKALVTATDLLACWLLLQLARRSGRPPHRALWYAANPLVVLEVAGMGHLEPLGVAACLAAGLALVAPPGAAGAGGAAVGRAQAGGFAAALAALAKLAPLAAWPMWARQSGRPAAFLLAAAGATAIAVIPVVHSVGGLPDGLAAYAVRWEAAGPLHEPLWRLLRATDAAGTVKHGLDLMKEWVGMDELWNRLYPWIYPQLLSRLLLAFAALLVVAASLRWREPVAASAGLFGALLLCSPTLYPWYLLWVLPWAALAGQRRWLWVAAAAPLSYLGGATPLGGWPWLHLLVWTPFLPLWWHDRRCAGA